MDILLLDEDGLDVYRSHECIAELEEDENSPPDSQDSFQSELGDEDVPLAWPMDVRIACQDDDDDDSFSQFTAYTQLDDSILMDDDASNDNYTKDHTGADPPSLSHHASIPTFEDEEVELFDFA